MPEQKTVMFPNFYFSPKQEWSTSANGYLLYIGRLSAEKGIVDFITQFMVDKNLKLNFIIAGSGPLEDSLREMVRSDQRIKLVGFVSGHQKNKLIAEAKFVVLPSKWYENNPISLIESLSFGTPVLATQAGGIPEIVEHGVQGYLFEWESKTSILNMFSQIQSQQKSDYGMMRADAIEKYNTTYTPRIFFKHLMAIYEKLSPQSAK